MILPPIVYTPPFGRASDPRVSVLYRLSLDTHAKLLSDLTEIDRAAEPAQRWARAEPLRRELAALPDNARGQVRRLALMEEIAAIDPPESEPVTDPRTRVAAFAAAFAGVIIGVRVGESLHYVPASLTQAVDFWCNFSLPHLTQIAIGVSGALYDADLPK